MAIVKSKRMKRLEDRVKALETALANGRVIIQAAQSNVLQPPTNAPVATLITEGPTHGETKFSGSQFQIILSNPSGK